MSGSHNLKYYAMNYYVSIMQKKQSSITQHYSLNDQEVKILPMKLVKLKTFRMSNKQSKKI